MYISFSLGIDWKEQGQNHENFIKFWGDCHPTTSGAKKIKNSLKMFGPILIRFK